MRNNIVRIAIIIILIFILLITYFSYYDYKPNIVEKSKIIKNQSINKELDKTVINLLIWNIGFGALGSEVDYFTAGGKMSVANSKEYVKKNLDGIVKLMRAKRIDFYLLQEVDILSKRSCYIDEYKFLMDVFKKSNSVFASNYIVKYIPYPFFNTLGKVTSGLVTLSKYNIDCAYRYTLPGNYIWPVRTVMPDRCILVTECNIKHTDKKLVLINIHNSAFDSNGKLRKQQIGFIKKYMLERYKQGNYIIVGGDWNFIFDKKPRAHVLKTDEFIPYEWKPADWKWAVDYKISTNRKLNAPYNKKLTRVKIIDGYLVSPNIDIVEVKGINHEFKFSDHNPVYMKVKLKGDV